ncbi:MAG TPA: pilus assembly PilX N-terminal domain-containing protein [Longimicrobium sp.]|nr:pilus assembly PilX N-terminal domain-containing protein [Longimicrobium sp.]
MDSPNSEQSPNARLDRRGIALPLALLGLVAVSVMVTAALLTSSTEAAVTNAHRDATQSLFQVEGGIQEYVATQGADLSAVSGATFTPTSGPDLDIDVWRLHRDVVIGGAVTNRERVVYAVRAEPDGGGRSLIAMVDVPIQLMNLNINAGATLGNNTKISGSIDINKSSNLCAGQVAGTAVLHAAGTTLTLSGQAKTNIGNDTSTFAGNREQLAAHTLNGLDLIEIADHADVKFGRRWFPDAPFSTLPGKPNGTQTDPRINWGCPQELITGCPGSSATRFPLVAIDASTASGARGEVRIQGDYGQGMLVVLNGDLRITGGFVFKGIILVEGNTDIHGGSGGSGGSKIEGALLGLGDLEICGDNASGECENSIGEGDGSDLSSGAVIQYNKCALNEVQQAINNNPIQAAPSTPTFAWFELVR